MNKIQINQSRMYGAVELVFDNNSKVLDLFPKLKAAREKFGKGQKLLDQFRQVQEINASGLTVGKVRLRENLIRQILHFSTILMAHAIMIEDSKLKILADYSENVLKRKSDRVLYDIGELLMNQVILVKTNLADYAVEDDLIDNMKNLLEIYKIAIPQKRGADNISKVSTGNIADVFKSQNKLLREEIDVLMGPLEFTHSDFFKTYMNARIVIDYKGGGKSTPPEPPAPK